MQQEISQNASAYSQEASNAALIKKLAPLVGLWKGAGLAQFPTITTCPYLEELRFESNGEEPVIHFEQKSWIQATGAPLHWESGFFKPNDAGELEILNAQNSGRVEVLRGTVVSEEAGSSVLSLYFESVVFGNDARMLRSSRRFHCAGDTLRYVVAIATVKTPEFQQHLTATLKRVA
ncbi:MAG: FABP family protein [Bdellovibrionales bacterium]|nr:FABP family protein [Bdellovibrionales bacterium]